MSDDELRDFDLSAWDAPPPRAGLADAVLARLRAAAPVTAIDSERPSRRWWIAGAALGGVAVASIALVIALGGSHRAASGHGDVVATRAQRLDLDTASAELDSGADVSWRRERGVLAVEQRRGSAMWRVGDDRLRIDAGAAVASVEATGASLRVEVHMQLSDARVVGASAITAAAVAFVTVVVYEGHVKVTASGQTVNVEPGATVEVRPGQPPGPPPLVGTDEQLRQLQQKVDQLQQQIDQDHVAGGPATPDLASGYAQVEAAGRACAVKLGFTGDFNVKFHVGADGKLASPTLDVQMHHSTGNDVDALGQCLREQIARFSWPRRAADYSFGFSVPAAIAEALDRDAISEAMRDVHPEVVKCGDQHPAKGTVKLHVRVAPDGNVASVDVEATPDAALGTCVANHVHGIQFPVTKNGGTFNYPFVFDGKSAACDADALDEKGRQDEAMGQHATALVSFEAALKCKPNDRRYSMAFFAACNMPNLAKAKLYYARLDPSRRPMLAQMCVRNGIRIDQLEAGLPASGTGVIEINAKPSAKILLDGVDTKKTTPTRLTVSPGRHKITFVVGQDRYTYPATVGAGETTTLDKDLE